MSDQLYVNGNPRFYQAQFKIDFDKVSSLEDLKLILKSFDMILTAYSPDNFKELKDKGLLIKLNENIL